MNWLVIALFSEGSTDRRFIPVILYRTVLELLLEINWRQVEIQEDIIIYEEKTNASRANKIASDKNIVDIFTIHCDSTKSQKDSMIQNIMEDIKLKVAQLTDMPLTRIQPLITIREMEAWALADANAIARACGSSNWPTNIPLRWNPDSVEDIIDPKETLNLVIRDLYGGRKGKKVPAGAVFLDQIATEVDFARLKQISSFILFYENMRCVLIDIKETFNKI